MFNISQVLLEDHTTHNKIHKHSNYYFDLGRKQPEKLAIPKLKELALQPRVIGILIIDDFSTDTVLVNGRPYQFTGTFKLVCMYNGQVKCEHHC